MIVRIDYPEPGVRLDLWGGTSGTFAGLDLFDRVVDQRWQNGTGGTPADVDRYQYGYDRNSNRLWKANAVGTPVVTGGLDELYAYDPLSRLTQMQRGVLNSTKTGLTGTPSREMDWSLDPTGNWSGYLTKTGGTTDLSQARTANKVNEITNVTESTGPTWVVPAYDTAGNMTTMPQVTDPTQGFTATYDSWNRMTGLSNSSGTVATYGYDGRGRRIVTTTASETRHFYWTNDWQDVEERVGSATSMDVQYAWGVRYVDEVVCRDDATSSPARRLYALQDANFNLTAIADSSGAAVERYVFDPYGGRTILSGTWGTLSASAYAWVDGHQGRAHDSDTGLIYSRYRYSQALVGTFARRDPLSYIPGSNLYELLLTSPTNTLDPLGLDTEGDRACCAGKTVYDPSVDCCENDVVVPKQKISVVDRDPNPLSGQNLGHVDMVVPGIGLVGYYGYGANMTGYLNTTWQDWYQGPTKRTEYVRVNNKTLSYICELNICPAQMAALTAAINNLKNSPGTFNLFSNNCAKNACDLLVAGGVLSHGISGILGVTPTSLVVAMKNAGANCYQGYTQLPIPANKTKVPDVKIVPASP